MKKLWNNLTIYLNDNEIFILSNKLTISYKSNYIYKSEVTNSKNFIKELTKNINKNKLYNLIIFLNKTISEKDIIYYNYIFEDLNILKLNIYSISILDLKYPIFIHNQNDNYIVNKDYIKEIELTSLKKYTKSNKYLYEIGNNYNIINNKRIYIISNKSKYIIEKIKNFQKV